MESPAIFPQVAATVLEDGPVAFETEGPGSEDDALARATEQSLSIIVELSLDGVVRWVSQTWNDVIG